jgi:hypothetical protein
MPRFRNGVLALTVPAVLLGGLAGVGAAEKAKPKRTCVNTREINVMRALDDKHVFVKVSAGRYYLFTMEERCHELHLARNLTVFEASTRVCADGTSLLAFDHPAAGPMRCRVSTIEPVKDLADAEERAAAEVPAK